MNLNRAIEHFGGVAQLAKALNIHRSAVYQWREKGRIPRGRAYQLQVLTDGALRVEGSADDSRVKNRTGS